MNDGLLTRTDILIKDGNQIELIEVKSKPYYPNDDYIFMGKRGGLVSARKPYLFDVAFQKYVIQKCCPDWKIKSLIMMANKSAHATVVGLNQFFRISKEAGNRTGVIKIIDSLDPAGNSVLGIKEVSAIVSEIINDNLPYSAELNCSNVIKILREHNLEDIYINWPTSFDCKSCEFVTDVKTDHLKSEFEQCFFKQHNWKETEFIRPQIFKI